MYPIAAETKHINIPPFYSKEEFSYFCRFDELTDVVACPGVILPTLEEAGSFSIDELIEDLDWD